MPTRISFKTHLSAIEPMASIVIPMTPEVLHKVTEILTEIYSIHPQEKFISYKEFVNHVIIIHDLLEIGVLSVVPIHEKTLKKVA